jgi:hypothetical protein
VAEEVVAEEVVAEEVVVPRVAGETKRGLWASGRHLL